MFDDYIQEIRERAGVFRPNERNLSLYFPDFATPPPSDCRNQVFGRPIGLVDVEWPVYPQLAELLDEAGLRHLWDRGDLRMEHVFTLDVRGLRLVGVPPGAAVMQLFVSNASRHGADHNGNPHAAVVFLGEEHLARGLYPGRLPTRSLQRWSRRFSLQQVDVPGDMFDPHEDETSPLARLQDAVWQAPARLGGCPIWLREPVDPRDLPPAMPPAPRAGLPGLDAFIMQFDRRFVDVDLGAHGVMYVAGTGAYFQAYEQAAASAACS